jgi:hypothetical protein
MKFSSGDADVQSMKVIELLIESGHYKGFRKEDVIKTIVRDANVLASALTERPDGEPPEALDAAPTNPFGQAPR